MQKKSEKTNKLLVLWYAHPRLAIAGVLVVANLLVILLFTVVLSLLSGNSFFGELSYIFTYTMCSDGIYDFVNNQEDLACFIVKIVLTILQMVIFSGALIGFATDLLQNTFDKRLENKGKLSLKNHYVLLNWSSIGANIIYDLSFLDGEKTIVILTEGERETVINDIESIFIENNRKKKGMRIFVKKGNPCSAKHLSDVSLSYAKYVGILLTNQENDGAHSISTKDLASFKLLISILDEAKKANIVVEVENSNTVTRIEQLLATTKKDSKNRVAIFSHNSVIGHILGRAVVNPLYSYLYHHVLSFEGVEFYACPSMSIDEALLSYNDCIPIANYGDLSSKDQTGNPQKLYYLSDNEKSLGLRKEKTSFVKPLKYKENINTENFTLFVFSDSNRAGFVEEEMSSYENVFNTDVTCKTHSYSDDLKEVIDEICNTTGEKKILLLSNETADADHQDADIFLTLLGIKSDGRISPDIEIFAEIVNPNNLSSLKGLGIATIIVSNKIISLFMVQLLTHPGSKKFYGDVLVSNVDADGAIDFNIIKAKELLDFTDGDYKFTCYSELVQSFYHASNKTRMIVGYRKAGLPNESIEFLCDKMDVKREIVISPNDDLVTVLYK